MAAPSGGARAALNAIDRAQQIATRINRPDTFVHGLEQAKYVMKLEIGEWSGSTAMEGFLGAFPSVSQSLREGGGALADITGSLANSFVRAIPGVGRAFDTVAPDLGQYLGSAADRFRNGFVSKVEYILPVPSAGMTDRFAFSWDEKKLGEETSGAISSAVGAAVGSVGRDAGVIAKVSTGLTVNDFMVMLFNKPQFKTYDLQWVFSPGNTHEADGLTAFINAIKRTSSPRVRGALWEFPHIFKLTLLMNNRENPKAHGFKYAVVEGLEVDYAGGGTMAYNRDGSATVVRVSMSFKEMLYWTGNDFDNVESVPNAPTAPEQYGPPAPGAT